MLLQSSLLRTKKFIQKTLHNFRFVVLGGYQKLPKLSRGCDEHHYMKNVHQIRSGYGSNQLEIVKSTNKLKEPVKEEKVCHGSFANPSNQTGYSKIKKEERSEDDTKSEKVRSELSDYYLVAKKLKELELMDMSDIEHELDIEEVIHYYSRLTCPVYLEIFDKFFMQVYSEFFNLHESQ